MKYAGLGLLAFIAGLLLSVNIYLARMENLLQLLLKGQ